MAGTGRNETLAGLSHLATPDQPSDRKGSGSERFVRYMNEGWLSRDSVDRERWARSGPLALMQKCLPWASGSGPLALTRREGSSHPCVLLDRRPPLEWVLEDVDRLLPELTLVPDDPVERLGQPQRADLAPRAEDSLCRVRLPGMEDVLEPPCIDDRSRTWT